MLIKHLNQIAWLKCAN